MSRNLQIGLFLTVSILLTTFTFYFWQIYRSPNLQTQEGDKPFALLIPPGSTFESVVDTLQKNDVLNDEVSFRFLAKLMKYPDLVKVGRYEITPRMSNRAALV